MSINVVNNNKKNSLFDAIFRIRFDEVKNQILNYLKILDVTKLSQDYYFVLDQIKIDGLFVANSSKAIDEINKIIFDPVVREIDYPLCEFVIDESKASILYNEFLPQLRRLNKIVQILEFINSFPGTSGKSNNLILLPKFGETLEQVQARQPKFVPPYTVAQYKEILAFLAQVRQELLDHIEETEDIVPDELKRLQQMTFLPKETLPYLSRGQAIGLLNKFEVGITLEMKFAQGLQK